MTLQDKDILAEDPDVLVNVNMVDDETYKQVYSCQLDFKFACTNLFNFANKLFRILIDESNVQIIVVMMS